MTADPRIPLVQVISINQLAAMLAKHLRDVAPEELLSLCSLVSTVDCVMFQYATVANNAVKVAANNPQRKGLAFGIANVSITQFGIDPLLVANGGLMSIPNGGNIILRDSDFGPFIQHEWYMYSGAGLTTCSVFEWGGNLRRAS